MQSAQGASLTVLPGSATAAFIPVPQTGAERYYAISSIVGGVLTLEHTVITGAAPPPPVGSDMSLTPGSGTVRTGQFVEVVATNVPDAAATVTFSITSGPNAGLVRPDNRPLVCDTNDFIANIVNAFKSGGRAAAGKVGSTGLATHTKSYQISTKLADAGYDLALELSDG